MEIVSLAELGAQVCLDGIVLFLVCKYLPDRDKQFLDAINQHTRQMNRLVNLWTNQLNADDKKRQERSDEVFKKDDATDKK